MKITCQQTGYSASATFHTKVHSRCTQLRLCVLLGALPLLLVHDSLCE